MTAHDQVLMQGLLESGAPISLHYRGGMSRGTGLLWEVNGTKGDIQVSGASGHLQMVQLALAGGREDKRTLRATGIPASLLPRTAG